MELLLIDRAVKNAARKSFGAIGSVLNAARVQMLRFRAKSTTAASLAVPRKGVLVLFVVVLVGHLEDEMVTRAEYRGSST